MAKRKYTKKEPEAVAKEPVVVTESMDMEQTFKPIEPPVPVEVSKSSSVMKIKLLNPKKVYFDVYTGVAYRGDGALKVVKMSHYIHVNTATNKEEAEELKKPFYKV